MSDKRADDDGLTDRWVDGWTLYERGAWQLPDEDRKKLLRGVSIPIDKVGDGELGLETPITLWEDIIAVTFLFWILGSIFWIPIFFALFLVFVRSPTAYAILFVVYTALSFHPVSRWEGFLHSRSVNPHALPHLPSQRLSPSPSCVQQAQPHPLPLLQLQDGVGDAPAL